MSHMFLFHQRKH